VSTFVCNKQQREKSNAVLCKVKVRFTRIWPFSSSFSTYKEVHVL